MSFSPWPPGASGFSTGAAVGGLLAASVVGLGGVAWAIPSFGFFMLSSLLSGVGRWRKAALAVQTEKGSERDAGQVLANGGVGWLLLVFYALFPLPLLYWGFVGAAGVLGSLGDSLIGATLQAQYWEPRSGRLTERPVS